VNKYCTKEGTYGSGWEPSFATFDIWAVDGADALMACCECGGGSTAGDPSVAELAGRNWYEKVGNGYCGATKEEELANRLSQWFYDQTKDDAEANCNSDPSCEGYHWSARNKHYVLISKVGEDTCCETENKDQCYRKIPVTDAPTAGPTVFSEPYSEVGRGYCGQTEEEEVANRIGSWAYTNSTSLAGDACTAEPLCAGYHWNEQDSSYVLLSKVGTFTCCETAKGDRCMRRAAELPVQLSAVEGQVIFSFGLGSCEFLEKMADVSTAVKEAIAAEGGSSITAGDVEVLTASGASLQVKVSPPQGVHARTVQSVLSSSPTLSASLKEKIGQVEGIDGSCEVKDMTSPVIEAVFSGVSAQEHLDAAFKAYSGSALNEATTSTTTTPGSKPLAPGSYVAPSMARTH
jgi:hypothetical protein